MITLQLDPGIHWQQMYTILDWHEYSIFIQLFFYIYWIGGLTASEIGTLTTTQVAAIEPSRIAEIPASTFVVCFTSKTLVFSTTAKT